MTPYGCCSHGNTTEEVGERGGGEKILYELYSVVIHSGSTHSGHYTAYIRDVDNLGSWTHPVSEGRLHHVMMMSFYNFMYPLHRFYKPTCKTNNFLTAEHTYL